MQNVYYIWNYLIRMNIEHFRGLRVRIVIGLVCNHCLGFMSWMCSQATRWSYIFIINECELITMWTLLSVCTSFTTEKVSSLVQIQLWMNFALFIWRDELCFHRRIQNMIKSVFIQTPKMYIICFLQGIIVAMLAFRTLFASYHRIQIKEVLSVLG